MPLVYPSTRSVLRVYPSTRSVIEDNKGKERHFYFTNFSNRGHVYLFTFSDFDPSLQLSSRCILDDSLNFQKALVHVGFRDKNIKRFDNLSVAAVKRELKNLQTKDNKRILGYVIGFFSYHDLAGDIYAYDGKFPLSDLFPHDEGTFKQKPKHYFIQVPHCNDEAVKRPCCLKNDHRLIKAVPVTWRMLAIHRSNIPDNADGSIYLKLYGTLLQEWGKRKTFFKLSELLDRRLTKLGYLQSPNFIMVRYPQDDVLCKLGK